jgi:hypothetical protein
LPELGAQSQCRVPDPRQLPLGALSTPGRPGQLPGLPGAAMCGGVIQQFLVSLPDVIFCMAHQFGPRLS